MSGQAWPNIDDDDDNDDDNYDDDGDENYLCEVSQGSTGGKGAFQKK